MAKFEVGMKWARITVIEDGWEYRFADGIKEPWDWVVLRCECGKEWRVDTWNLNRHLTKSCGECPDVVAGGEVGPRGGKAKVKSERKPGRPVMGKSKSLPVMVTLPEHLVKAAKAKFCSGEDGMSFSALLAECLEEKCAI